MPKKCPKCGHDMIEIVSDPIFKQVEYICPFCKILETEKSRQQARKYLSADQIILEEIKRIYTSRLDLEKNWEMFNKYSNFKITFEKYQKIINNEVEKLKEKVRKK
ncbi:MAG: hypothetical protein ACTSQO_14265 [Candidatus Helarchaeota archaeon]